MEMKIWKVVEGISQSGRGLPRAEIEAALGDPGVYVPEFTALVERDASDIRAMVKRRGYVGYVPAFMYLAKHRVSDAYSAAIEFCSHVHRIDNETLGDFVGLHLHRVLASLSGGDAAPLKGLIEADDTDDFIRHACIQALVVMANMGHLSRAELVGYFRELFNGKLRRRATDIWSLFVFTCRDIYPDELMEDIERVYADGLMDMYIPRSDFWKVLGVPKKRALRNLAANPRYQPVEDVLEEMKNLPCYLEDDWDGPDVRIGDDTDLSPRVGRNEPCPCGSGRKYKKCCLRASA